MQNRTIGHLRVRSVGVALAVDLLDVAGRGGVVIRASRGLVVIRHGD